MTELQVAVAIGAGGLVLLVALGCCLTYIVWMKLAAKDIENHILRQERDAGFVLAEQGICGLEQIANRKRQEHGGEPLPVMPGVIPHHDSPVTQRNQDAADVGDLRARMAVVAVDLALDLPPSPRLEYVPGVEPRSRGSTHAE